VVFTFPTRGCGCDEHPAFPAPSVFEAKDFWHDPDAMRAAGRSLSCPDLIRASINLRKDFFRRRWIIGPSPRRKGLWPRRRVKPGDDDLENRFVAWLFEI
jgi:hypothetical protein